MKITPLDPIALRILSNEETPRGELHEEDHPKPSFSGVIGSVIGLNDRRDGTYVDIDQWRQHLIFDTMVSHLHIDG